MTHEDIEATKAPLIELAGNLSGLHPLQGREGFELVGPASQMNGQTKIL